MYKLIWNPSKMKKYLRSSDEEWIVFVDAFDKLIQNNSDVVGLTAMNLPTDWKDHLSV